MSPAAGAPSRFDIALSTFSGMAISTMFTLFVTPSVYTFLAHDHAALMAREKALGGGRGEAAAH